MKNFFLFLFTVANVICACDKTPPGAKTNPYDWDAPVEHEMIVLGEQLEDPYSVENMTEALEALYPTKAGRLVLEPTNLYVRFLPSNRAQYDILAEMGLQLIDHPVDYQIVKEGDYYHDPAIAEGDITWQYAVVPVGFNFPPDIHYELLEECFLPDSSPLSKSADIDWSEVEREAFRLSGNADLLCPLSKANDVAPEGIITISDPDYSEELVGVKGVMVSCNSFVKFGKAYTDAEGKYQMRTVFSGKPRFRLVFKNSKGFCIGFNMLLVPASVSTLGRCEAPGISVHIDRSSEKKLFCRAVVNNAAYDYYEACICEDRSISLPPSNLRIWLLGMMSSSCTPMFRHGAVVEDGVIRDYLGEYVPLVELFLPDILLGIKDVDSYYGLYAKTMHELAHSSHFMQVGKAYWNEYINYVLFSFVSSGFERYGSGLEENHGYCEVGEMWAYYMQNSLCRERYPEMTDVFGTQYWFSPQILLYLEDRGINRYKIFEALKSDITDRELLRERLLLLWPEAKNTINQAFGRYN